MTSEGRRIVGVRLADRWTAQLREDQAAGRAQVLTLAARPRELRRQSLDEDLAEVEILGRILSVAGPRMNACTSNA